MRATVAAADPHAEFLAATAFLDAPAAGGLPDWSPEPPPRAQGGGPSG
ncbi:hypothetical protein ACWDBD_37050 [Streptomyces sp. NPDC001118]